jgi:hypothetical protein
MAEAVKLSAAPIVTNQFEYHPYVRVCLTLSVFARARRSGAGHEVERV